MKTYQKFVTEARALSGTIPKRFHPETYEKAVDVGRRIYGEIHGDSRQNYDSMMPRDGSPHEVPFSKWAESDVGQALGEFHRSEPNHLGPKATPALIMHAAKRVVQTTEGGGDEQWREHKREWQGKEKRKAQRIARRAERDDIVAGINKLGPDDIGRLHAGFQYHTLAARNFNPVLHGKGFIPDQKFRAKAMADRLRQLGQMPQKPPRNKPTRVTNYTNSGNKTSIRNMPPFEKP